MTAARSWRQFRLTLMAGDALVVVLTYALADFLRCAVYMGIDWPELLSNGQSSVRVHIKVLIFLPFVWPLLLMQLRAYALRWQTRREIFSKTLLATLLLALFVSAVALVFERERFPRAQIGIFAALLPATTLAARGITLWMLVWLSRQRFRNVLIVGTDRNAVRLRRLAQKTVFARAQIIGHLTAPWDGPTAAVEELSIKDAGTTLESVLDAEVVDDVLISVPIEALGSALPMVRTCEEMGVAVALQVDAFSRHGLPELTDLHGLPVMAFTPVRHPPELLAAKRLGDIVGSVIGIILTGPIMLACALLIRLTSRGPILFRQQRSGLNGRAFVMYKFRTMQRDAEDRRAEIAHLNESDGPVFKIRRDPRITRIGSILRRWSLDELPQLFNVLKGDMSIVGPRPPIPAEVAEYDRWQRRRLSMRPGLTCLWQIMGRHHIGFDEWMRLDLYYIDHWSLTLDALIVAKTVPTVLGGTGA